MTERQPIDDADEALVARARAGDRLAFGQLMQRSDEAMRRLAFRLLGSRSAMDDALQDAYLKAFRHLDQFDGRSRFSTWLYTITYRTCLDHLRARGRRRELDLDAIAGDERNVDAVGVDVSDAVVGRMALARALHDLPPDQAAAVILVDGEGYSYDDVATVLGVAPGTVGSRLSRGRASLRQRLGVDAEGGRA